MILAKDIANDVLAKNECLKESLNLAFGEFCVAVLSNNQQLLDNLREYFSEFIANENQKMIQRVHVLESSLSKPDVEFINWSRDPGKAGRKDAFYDTPDGRLCLKVRTGMNYVLCKGTRIAYGPALKNFSQAVNFIISQHIEWLMNQGCLICHAAAVAYKGSGIALSAFSGGGKSTTALHLMDYDLDFISNDRLFIHHQNNKTEMFGVAKQPRINPGTILNNQVLRPLIPESRIKELEKMDKQSLWQLEDKYDAMIEPLYGKNRFQLAANIHAHVVLNWQHDSENNTELKLVDISQRQDLLEAIMKSPGPFYMDQNGQGWQNGGVTDKQTYIDVLSNIEVYEISGKVDFDAMLRPLIELVKK